MKNEKRKKILGACIFFVMNPAIINLFIIFAIEKRL